MTQRSGNRNIIAKYGSTSSYCISPQIVFLNHLTESDNGHVSLLQDVVKVFKSKNGYHVFYIHIEML